MSARPSPRSCRPYTTSTPATWTNQAKPPRRPEQPSLVPGASRVPPIPARPELASGARPTWEDGGVRVVVLSDTHAPRRWRACPSAVAGYLRQADAILHTGDVCTAAVLTEPAEYAPVTAVMGH